MKNTYILLLILIFFGFQFSSLLAQDITNSPYPKVNAGEDFEICVDFTTALGGLPSGHTWTVVSIDGVNQTKSDAISKANFTPTQAGTYVLKYTHSQITGTDISDTRTAIVHPTPAILELDFTSVHQLESPEGALENTLYFELCRFNPMPTFTAKPIKGAEVFWYKSEADVSEGNAFLSVAEFVVADHDFEINSSTDFDITWYVRQKDPNGCLSPIRPIRLKLRSKFAELPPEYKIYACQDRLLVINALDDDFKADSAQFSYTWFITGTELPDQKNATLLWYPFADSEALNGTKELNIRVEVQDNSLEETEVSKLCFQSAETIITLYARFGGNDIVFSDGLTEKTLCSGETSNFRIQSKVNDFPSGGVEAGAGNPQYGWQKSTDGKNWITLATNMNLDQVIERSEITEKQTYFRRIASDEYCSSISNFLTAYYLETPIIYFEDSTQVTEKQTIYYCKGSQSPITLKSIGEMMWFKKDESGAFTIPIDPVLYANAENNGETYKVTTGNGECGYSSELLIKESNVISEYTTQNEGNTGGFCQEDLLRVSAKYCEDCVYEWYIGNDFITSGIGPNFVHTISKTGSYRLRTYRESQNGEVCDDWSDILTAQDITDLIPTPNLVLTEKTGGLIQTGDKTYSLCSTNITTSALFETQLNGSTVSADQVSYTWFLNGKLERETTGGSQGNKYGGNSSHLIAGTLKVRVTLKDAVSTEEQICHKEDEITIEYAKNEPQPTITLTKSDGSISVTHDVEKTINVCYHDASVKIGGNLGNTGDFTVQRSDETIQHLSGQTPNVANLAKRFGRGKITIRYNHNGSVPTCEEMKEATLIMNIINTNPIIYAEDTDLAFSVDVPNYDEVTWYKSGDNTIISTEPTIPNQNETYFVKVKVADCEFTSKAIRLVGTDQNLTAQGIQIYPNPAENVLHIQSLYDEIQEIEIYDTMGRKQFKEITSMKDINKDITCLQSGVYFIKIQTVTKVFLTKIIKK